MKRERQDNNKISKKQAIEGKELVIQVMQLIVKDTFEDRTGQILIEKFLEDLQQLMSVSNQK